MSDYEVYAVADGQGLVLEIFGPSIADYEEAKKFARRSSNDVVVLQYSLDDIELIDSYSPQQQD